MRITLILKFDLVGSATYKGLAHAMVLDTTDNETFIFKNTYEKDKQVKIAMNDKDAPDEFFFVHIDYKKTISRKQKCPETN